MAAFGLLLVVVQIILGGWTSSNYAAMACPDFPTCQALWWPEMNFSEGFSPLHEVGIDYEGGVLDGPARTAIHMAHRIGALVVFLLLIDIAVLTLVKAATPRARQLALVIIAVLLVQVGLGISNVLAGLPLMVAAAHNGVGALLLLAVLSLNLSLVPARVAVKT
jgi:cytochrome c oxidase assembly protein subunit 15